MKKSGGNITDMTNGLLSRAMCASISQVEAYWHALCDGGSLPRRCDIDPRALDTVLDYAFVLERIAPGICRFRIAGQHFEDLLGMDVRGMPISAMFSGSARAQIGQIVEQVCAAPCINELLLRSQKTMGRAELTGKMFLAPLLDDAGQVTRILGCLQTSGKIGRSPRHFSVTHVQTKSLGSGNPNLQQHRRGPRQIAFAESGAKFRPAPAQPDTPKQVHPFVRLVVDNA